MQLPIIVSRKAIDKAIETYHCCAQNALWASLSPKHELLGAVRIRSWYKRVVAHVLWIHFALFFLLCLPWKVWPAVESEHPDRFDVRGLGDARCEPRVFPVDYTKYRH